ncbi:MAG: radical SAM protein [Thermoplasmatales archaeon]|nr:MAG: radical SAM protein [Thermoplasmatales archaeon]
MSKESPVYVRTSLAAAMTIGYKNGLFYRNARSPCVNLLLTYSSGCAGNCGYCGLSMRRPGVYKDKSFIRVEWPSYKLKDIIKKISQCRDRIQRICLSMITNKQAREDTIEITRTLKQSIDIPISLLISPSILEKDDLVRFKENGAEMIGIAVDCATPSLFEKIRGKGVNGPHKWKRYWECYQDAIKIFGERKVGVHLIVGFGETEREMIETIQKAYDMGGSTHLFSFFPEGDSLLSQLHQPPIGQYRRVQLARFLIDEGIRSIDDFSFDLDGRLINFGMLQDNLSSIIQKGTPFMTSGCPGRDGKVACNRPYANCLPGPKIRNYPFKPEMEDIQRILGELWS